MRVSATKVRSQPISVSFCTSSRKRATTSNESKGFYPFILKLTGQVANIPPFKDFDIPLLFPTGLDLKFEQDPYNLSPICDDMDVLDLYESGDWSAASSPCSELFDDIPSPTSSLDDSCISDFSIDLTSYLDPAALSTNPDDLCKYLPRSHKSNEVEEKQVEVVKDSCRYPNLVVKSEPKDGYQKPIMSFDNGKPLKDGHHKKLPSSQLKAPSSRSSRKHSSSKRMPEKQTDEYRMKRERNNIAVRKSRFKTKKKFVDTVMKVEELTEENDRLHSRVDHLTKELNALRGLFSNPSIFKDQALARAILAQGMASSVGHSS
ncbi:hypothetical protein QZH41_007985 [Actinostola sp. cb2023]|nr:hypothetical protein QZH41_007985 [Actinostola sp. cb2023]